MEFNSAGGNFSKILNLLSDKLNREKDSFEKFKILTTFNFTVRNNSLFKYCKEGKIEEAMSFLTKLSPKNTVPKYVSILSKCNFILSEEPEQVTLVAKGKEKETLRIKNDVVGSGRDAVQVAAVQFASIKDKLSYHIDFNAEERRRKIEKHSEGNLTYEEYLAGIEGTSAKRSFVKQEVMDEEGEFTIQANQDTSVVGIHHPDTVEEIFALFSDTQYGFTVRVMKNKKMNFKTPNFKVGIEGNMYTFIPVNKMEYVKGPECDTLIQEILAFLQKNATPAAGEKIGLEEYDCKRAYKEVCRTQSPNYVPDVKIRTEQESVTQLRLLKGVREDVRKKFFKVKYDYENSRDNIQINKDSYNLIMVQGFKVFRYLTKQVTQMKTSMRGMTFPEVVEQGAKIFDEAINSTFYLQSVIAKQGSENFAGKDISMYTSLFLDTLIRSAPQFPPMSRGVDGNYRFDSDFRNNTVDASKDPYEMNKEYAKSQLIRMRQMEESSEQAETEEAHYSWAEQGDYQELDGKEEEDEEYNSVGENEVGEEELYGDFHGDEMENV